MIRPRRQVESSALRVVVLVLMSGVGCAPSPHAAPLPQLLSAETTENQPQRWILIQKTARVLSLYEGKRIVKTYPVVLGKDPLWAKLQQGDHRTPEGEYHIIYKYYHPSWSRFMLLDYPTAFNEEIFAWSLEHHQLATLGGQPPSIGGAVGIHGTDDESLNRRGVNWTEGCISLFNRDVDELYDLVPLGTRVLIQR